jgi:hypothetical protein
MNNRDRTNLKKMLGGMAIIMSTSLLMHIFVFSKGPRAYRPQVSVDFSPDAAKEMPAVTGRVVVLGADRFYLDEPSGRRWMFMLENTYPPALGSQLSVVYLNTKPPTFVRAQVVHQ